MLISSFARRLNYRCPRSLVKRANGTRAPLRHFAARVEVRHCKQTQSKSCQIFESQKSLRNMSDDAYSSFLDQANQDTGASKASTKSKSAATKAVDTDVPVTLQKVDQYYTSESDEPFEPVSLKWRGGNMPSESMQPQRPQRPSF